MNEKKHLLSSSYQFNRVQKIIQNRTVLAAMTNKQSYDNGIISQEEIDWLENEYLSQFFLKVLHLNENIDFSKYHICINPMSYNKINIYLVLD